MNNSELGSDYVKSLWMILSRSVSPSSHFSYTSTLPSISCRFLWSTSSIASKSKWMQDEKSRDVQTARASEVDKMMVVAVSCKNHDICIKVGTFKSPFETHFPIEQINTLYVKAERNSINICVLFSVFLWSFRANDMYNSTAKVSYEFIMPKIIQCR